MIHSVSIATVGGILVFHREFVSVQVNDQICLALNNPTLTELTQPSRFLQWKQDEKTIFILQSQMRLDWIGAFLDLLACSLLQFRTDVFGSLVEPDKFEHEFDLILKGMMIMPVDKPSGPRY
jgi:hypothetical protein